MTLLFLLWDFSNVFLQSMLLSLSCIQFVSQLFNVDREDHPFWCSLFLLKVKNLSQSCKFLIVIENCFLHIGQTLHRSLQSVPLSLSIMMKNLICLFLLMMMMMTTSILQSIFQFKNMHALPALLGAAFVSDRVYIHGICSATGHMGSSHPEMAMIGKHDGVILMRP